MKKYFIAAGIILLFIWGLSRKGEEFNQSLSNELIAMAEKDQETRVALLVDFSEKRTDNKVMKEHWDSVNAIHTQRLKQIVERHGWPGYNLVGKKASNSAWTVIQHSKDLAFQKKVLELLENAVQKKDANPHTLAYLTDRVRVTEGLPQVYGTQIKREGNTVTPYEIENPKDIDKKRLAIGMDSLSVFLRGFMQ